ncbi:hypothetical protein PMAYCL1PPCAC_26770, partial [Pristionchus mayeri]
LDMSAGRPFVTKEPKEEPLDDFPSSPPDNEKPKEESMNVPILPSMELKEEPMEYCPSTPPNSRPNPPRPIILNTRAWKARSNRKSRTPDNVPPVFPLRRPPIEVAREARDRRRNGSLGGRSSGQKADARRNSSLGGRSSMLKKDGRGEESGKEVDITLSLLNLDDSHNNNNDISPPEPKMRRMEGGKDVVTRHRSPSHHRVSFAKEHAVELPSAYAHVADKPVHDAYTLCFPLPFHTDYESIFEYFESIRASVTVIRRPVVGRPGVVVLKWRNEAAADIALEESPTEFVDVTINPTYPGLIEFSINRDDVDLSVLEEEIEAQFGIVAELSLQSSHGGTVRFVDEEDALDALKEGRHKCEILPGVRLSFTGVTMPRGGEVEEWEVEMDGSWPEHPVKMKHARSVLIDYTEEEERSWR